MISTKKIRFFLSFLAIISICILSTGCSSENEPISRTGFYFNTVINVSIYSSDNEELLDDCMQLASKYENLFSMTKEGSDIWNINHANGKPVTVSSDTIELLNSALYYSKLSGGRFDPTIGSVSSLWDFSSDNPGPVPDSNLIQNALKHVDYNNISISGNTVTLEDSAALIDPGAIAKGYIADRMKELLVQNGVDSAIINLGGNVLLIGSKPDGSDFSIGIQKPFEDNSTYITTISESDISIVSSGTYERYFEQDGRIYHHILDAYTGYPVSNNLLSVTILSPLSVDGDGLSTTCFILGLDDGLKLINSIPDVEAVFVTDDYKLHYSDNFPN